MSEDNNHFYLVLVLGPVQDQTEAEKMADQIRGKPIEGTDLDVQWAYVANRYGAPLIYVSKPNDEDS